ncbi:MAG TPA: hypothetical protein VFZ98_05485, partial [Vicinamibacterales bacterium]
RPEQRAIVEEFFELFKTPWEFWQRGRDYGVVIATSDDVADVDASVLLLYTPQATTSDRQNGIQVDASVGDDWVTVNGTRLPIYGRLTTFTETSGGARVLTTASNRIAGLRTASRGRVTLRIGYDLFDEVKFLLSTGQPVEHAHIPTLDAHIAMLREWILRAGIPVLEIPPSPAGHPFAVCLTHDIDFVGIRRHKLDHSMWGFVYRATFGALGRFFRGRLRFNRLRDNWRAVAALPFVYLGWARDFWDPFEWYLREEHGLPSTYFLIPYKGRPGERVGGRHAARRATAYDVTDIAEWTSTLMNAGCEIGVHGIDAWHDAAKGAGERARVATASGTAAAGIRMHWLLHDDRTPATLEAAGYAYDSTSGYNDTVGYRNGTAQVFRPDGAYSLLELPLHIQDGALFYTGKMNLSEQEADERCQSILDNANRFGGVLTLLWHDRSHAPERFWGDFYVRLIERLKSWNPWFGTAGQVVEWYRKRREVRFEAAASGDGRSALLQYAGEEIVPPLVIRLYEPADEDRGPSQTPPSSRFVDMTWNGRTGDVPRDVLGSLRRNSLEISLPHRSELLRL